MNENIEEVAKLGAKRVKSQINCAYCGRRERAANREALRERMGAHLRNCRGYSAWAAWIWTNKPEAWVPRDEVIPVICREWIPEEWIPDEAKP